MKKNDNSLELIVEENKRKLFSGDRYEPHTSEDEERYNDVVESPEYAEAYRELAERIIPAIDVRDPSTWAFYGSAEKYYKNSFNYIQNSFPYDGSSLEKIQWALSASAIDLAVLQHEYPLATGHVGFSSSSWGSRAANSGRYGLSDIPEYIKFSGGPYVGTTIDSTTSRESSLKIDPTIGNTIEFWLKKPSFVGSSKTESEIVFDSCTSDFGEASSNYGRFLLELSSGSASPIYVTYMSGAFGADRQQIGSGITAADIADNQFHHYALTAYHTGSNLELELYVDGVFNDKVLVSCATFSPVNSHFNATIGALRAQKDSTGGLGYGKLSGFIDEFRFWKTKRTAEQIGNYYDFPVNGATDQEKINSLLGVYYKFNEGNQGNDKADKVVLDYSGRMNNGEIVGYSLNSRSDTSAITLSSVTNQRETGDPVISSVNSSVKTKLAELESIGKVYDEQNHASLFRSVPQWAYDTPAGSNNINSDFSILLQAIGQQFDSIRMLIDGLPKIGFTQYKDFVYAKGSANYLGNSQFYNLLGCEKDFNVDFRNMFGEENFSAQNLLGKGFNISVSPIVDKATLNEYFYNLKFDISDPKTNLSQALVHSKADNLKNKILNSIHSNISRIFKQKGTKESFRNLIRCFGVDENLVIPNIYAQNIENHISNSTLVESKAIKSLTLTGSNNSVTLLQTSSAANERNFILGQSSPSSMTVEAKVLFPVVLDDNKTAITASVLGVNQVVDSTLQISNPNSSGIRLYTVKSTALNKGCKFQLSSSEGLFTTLNTDYFSNVYDNTPWFLSYRLSEDTSSPLLNTDNKGTQTYKIDFIGYRYDTGVKTSKFEMSTSITQANYQNLMAGNKSIFVGAEKENITGSVINISDCKLLQIGVWDDYLTNEELTEHAKSYDNFGRTNPLEKKRGNQGESRLRADSFILNWQFDNVTNLSENEIYVHDHSSGSLDAIKSLGEIVGPKYPAISHNSTNQLGLIKQEYLTSVKHVPIDNLETKSRIEIKDTEVEVFQIDSRPVTYLHSFEKSMYQVISKEMLNLLAGAESFNNLIGEPVYKYRQEYKSLEKLRERFFSKVENDVDLDRFIEYYKWIDSSLSTLLEQLQPATSNMKIGLEDVVESHAFERSKYKHQAPQFEFKEPKLIGQILGVNELLYDWEHGHAPLSNSQADNCLWWADRANKETNKLAMHVSSSDSTNSDRESLRQRRNTNVSGSTYVLRKLSRPYRLSSERLDTFEIGSNRKANKNKNLHRAIINSGKQIKIEKSDIYEFKQCNDVINPQEEKIYTAKTNTTGTEGYLDADADMILPFSLYSSSAGQDFSNFKENLKITNNHDDQMSVLQSTHVRSLVGGMPHRRVKFGTPDADRPEAYILSASSTTLTLKQSTGPKSYTTRNMGIQSPYSLTNIKQNINTTPVTVGNYVHDYDIVMTAGRNSNNSYLVESGSVLITPVSIGHIIDMPDFTSPARGRAEHIIVNQFSSPGSPETQGVYARDKESGEFSIYNTLNYRNLSVRQPLDLLASEKSERFGFRSGSAVNASAHMVNRNFFHMTTSLGEVSKPDNQFVQHAIPQNDFGYSWIAASAANSKFEFVNANDGFGHQHLLSSSSAKAIQFLSASLVGSILYHLGPGIFSTSIARGRVFGMEKQNVVEGAEDYAGVFDFEDFNPVDFAGLNTHIHDLLATGSNTLGHPTLEYSGGVSGLRDANYINQKYVSGYTLSSFGETGGDGAVGVGDGLASILNSIILNRQGPYGWPTWKQIRGGEHPITRAHQKTNTFSRVFLGDPTIGADSILRSSNTPSMNLGAEMHRGISSPYERARILDQEVPSVKSRIIKNYKEMPVTNKSKPSRIILHSSIRRPSRQILEWSSGDDFRLPHYFKQKRERGDFPRLSQEDRESTWTYDGYYYQNQLIDPSNVVNVSNTFQNDLNSFSNEDIIKDIEFKEKSYHKHLDLVSSFLAAENADLRRTLEISYEETVYPREINTFSDNARNRIYFDYFPWKSSREKRNIQLSGNISHNIKDTLFFGDNFYAFSQFLSKNLKDHKHSIFGSFDALRLHRVSSANPSRVPHQHLSMSSWPLDARKDFTTKPVRIDHSYLNDGNLFLTSSTGRQGTFGEGVLQNDFSTFPLGMNNLYGTPPISMVYNRRIPQPIGSHGEVYLSGEAKWEAGDNNKGPFYDSYEAYSEEIKRVAPNHTLVSEFRMSEYVEDIINNVRDYPNIGNDFLTLTGAIYQNSSGDIDIGGKFFKTYSNSDFLKYFSLYEDNILGDTPEPDQKISHGRINFKCKAAMKFLPYRGFYPAERAVDIVKLFHNNYLSDSLIESSNISPPPGSGLNKRKARSYSKLRANASRYQATKPLFGPGILFNSIKSGVAVDYPIFPGDFSNVYSNLSNNTIMNGFDSLNFPANSLFTGSMINGSTGSTGFQGIPRLTASAEIRVKFEDLLSPANIFGESMFDNEPHPSASLIYGNQHFHNIIERPGLFGKFNELDAQKRLGLNLTNTRRAFSRQMSPYTLASHNFAAETVNFFLEDGHLTTAISKPIRERFEAGSYKMRVHIDNVDTVMYDRHSAFGPPVDDSANGVNLTQYTQVGSTATRANFKLTFNDHHGSGGSVQYNVNAATASHLMPQLVFRDENEKSLHVFLYNEDHFTAPGNPSSESGAVKVYLTSSAYAGVKSIFKNDQENLWNFGNDHVALINVKNALGSAVASSFETALEDAGLNLDVIVNRASNILAVTSSVFGPRNFFRYAESSRFSTQVEIFQGLPQGGSYQDGTTGKDGLETNVYAEDHGLFIDFIIDGQSGQPSVFTTSVVSSETEHGFAPFVPPFLDPNSSPYVEITFTPSADGIYGAQEIIQNSTFEYYNFHTAPSNATYNTNYRQSMALSASLNLGMCATLRTDNLEQIEGHGQNVDVRNINLREIDPNNLLQRWVIQTKWETPVMDFSQVTASAYDVINNSVTQVSGSPWKNRYWDSYYDRGKPRAANVTSGTFLTGSTGMWHQKGAILGSDDSKGYFLSIKDVPQSDGSGGLAEKLGFNEHKEESVGALKKAKKYRNRIGLVEDRKVVKEAIVAIPYVLREDLDNQIEFVRLSNGYYEIARQNVTDFKNQMKSMPLTDRILTIDNYNDFRAVMDARAKIPPSETPVDAIEYQLFMMDEYVLPPQLDFTRIPRNAAAGDIPDPFMIYFFQFHASFDKEDLSNIWQNLYPKSPGSTASPRYSYANERLQGRLRPHNDVSYVSHYLDTVELNDVSLCPADDPKALFHPGGNNKTRWLVFKVKQRAENSLEDIRRRSIDPRVENIESLQYLAEAKSSENALTLPRNLPGRREDGTLDLQFNWPYDYFSFVELIKLDVKIDSFNHD